MSRDGCPIVAIGVILMFASASARSAEVSDGVADGFGERATGGTDEVRVSGVRELASAAVRDGVRIVMAPGDHEIDGYVHLKGSRLTLEGGGATFWKAGGNRSAPAMLATGGNVVLRNFRVRNGGDNLAFGTGGTKANPGHDILVEHVSSTGSGDDGISPSYNARDITVRWSLVAGCTRSVFIKYGGTRISMHHNIITRQWIRGPVANGEGCEIDFRNNLVWNWAEWASRVDAGARGNFVGNVWRFDEWAPGKRDSALAYCTAGTTSRGNLFRNCSAKGTFSSEDVVKSPPIQGEVAAAEIETLLLDDRTGAGCVPRDAIDKEYLTVRQCAPKGDPAVGLQVPAIGRRTR